MFVTGFELAVVILWHGKSAILLRLTLIMPRCAAVGKFKLASWAVKDVYARVNLTSESHEPVQSDIASLLTPRQLTRLSCP